MGWQHDKPSRTRVRGQRGPAASAHPSFPLWGQHPKTSLHMPAVCRPSCSCYSHGKPVPGPHCSDGLTVSSLFVARLHASVLEPEQLSFAPCSLQTALMPWLRLRFAQLNTPSSGGVFLALFSVQARYLPQIEIGDLKSCSALATASITHAGPLSGACCCSMDGTASCGWSRCSSKLHLPHGTAVGLHRHTQSLLILPYSLRACGLYGWLGFSVDTRD